jgi:hypothetical protein
MKGIAWDKLPIPEWAQIALFALSIVVAVWWVCRKKGDRP